jgi:hypothetical protein
MNTDTQFAYCAWHKGHSDTAQLVQVLEQNSGPGHELYACDHCRRLHGLPLYADQPRTGKAPW